MGYGVMFGDKHSFSDWCLLWEKFEITYPDAKTYSIDIPGANGILDLTDALTPVVKYSNRSVDFVFSFCGDYEEWHSTLNKVANYLHGKKMKIISDTETDYYYVGRLKLDTEKTDDTICQLTITGDVEPYKYELLDSVDAWLWDPFQFETGVIREYKDIIVNGSTTVEVIGSEMPVSPVFICSSDMTMAFDGNTYSLFAGENRIYGFYIRDGDYKMTFEGTGTVSIEYRGGKL